MARKYVRKTQPKYSASDLSNALAAIKDKQLTVVAAARQFHIPVTTLCSRLSGHRGNGTRGGRTILTKEEERFLVHVVELFQSWQQPLSRTCVIDMARTYMIELGKNISPDAPLTDWFQSFMGRWKNELKMASSVKLESTRSQSCTKEMIGESKNSLNFF
jgi:hypothetical protein